MTTNAMLNPLAMTFGPVATLDPMSGSPAIDQGTCTDPNGTTVAVDERGLTRPQGITCDIGAVEIGCATACPYGDACGATSNACGGMLSCGTCTAPQTCGGVTPNVCCAPLTVCPSGDNCGTIPDGCGGMLSCGTCTAPQTCAAVTANVCGCVPETACPTGDDCGTISDGCGGMVNCGTCTAPQTCGAVTANVCGCAPFTVCPGEQDCGMASDGCGGIISCGTCAANQTCTNDACVTVDAGSPMVDAGQPADAGTTTKKSSGCGCSADGSSLVGLLGIALALPVRRRHRCQS